MRNWLKRSMVMVAALILAAQIYQPSKINPAIDPQKEIGANLAVHPRVAEIFERSCMDCHSNRTVWPWYSNIAPVSWLIASDVNEGRRELNFSEWAAYNPKKINKLLEKVCKEPTNGKMPQFPYSLMHPSAKLTNADIQALCDWTTSVRESLPTVAPEISEVKQNRTEAAEQERD